MARVTSYMIFNISPCFQSQDEGSPHHDTHPGADDPGDDDDNDDYYDDNDDRDDDDDCDNVDNGDDCEDDDEDDDDCDDADATWCPRATLPPFDASITAEP